MHASSSTRPFAMEGQAGLTMTELSANVDPSLRWNTILPGLVTVPAKEHNSVRCARREVDHIRANCALLCLQSPTQTTASIRRRSDNVCISWNRGACIFPGICAYRHVCATCQLPHRAKDCLKTPESSSLEQQRGTQIQPDPINPRS